MWREIRNLIVHHDRVVHADFELRHKATWDANESSSRGEAARPLQTGVALPIDTIDVIFCFTPCFKTAELLHDALTELAAGGAGMGR